MRGEKVYPLQLDAAGDYNRWSKGKVEESVKTHSRILRSFVASDTYVYGGGNLEGGILYLLEFDV